MDGIRDKIMGLPSLVDKLVAVREYRHSNKKTLLEQASELAKKYNIDKTIKTKNGIFLYYGYEPQNKGKFRGTNPFTGEDFKFNKGNYKHEAYFSKDETDTEALADLEIEFQIWAKSRENIITPEELAPTLMSEPTESQKLTGNYYKPQMDSIETDLSSKIKATPILVDKLRIVKEYKAIKASINGFSKRKGRVLANNLYSPRDTKNIDLSKMIGSVVVDGIGEMLIYIDGGYYYGYLVDSNMYLSIAIMSAVSGIDELKSKIPKYRDTIIEKLEVAKRLRPNPDDVIPKKEVAKLKSAVNLMLNSCTDHNERKLPMSITVKSGIATIANPTTQITLKDKIKFPDIDGKDAEELKPVSGDIIMENGIFYNGSNAIFVSDIDTNAITHRGANHFVINKSKESDSALSYVKKALDRFNPKQEVNWIFLEANNGEAVAVGTDTRRLAISSKFKVNGTKGEYTAMLKSIHVSPKTTTIEIGEDTTKSENDTYTIVTKNLKGRYPDYKRIIPQAKKGEVTFDVGEFDMDKIDTDDIEIRISSSGMIEVKTLHTEIPKKEGDKQKPDEIVLSFIADKPVTEPIVFAINTKYLNDAIKWSKKATIQYREPNLPILVLSDNGKSVIMPIII